MSKPSIQKSSLTKPTNLNNTNPYTTKVGGTINGFPGTPITIKCIVTGEPSPIIKWLKDGVDVKLGPRTFIDTERSLVISKTVRDDSGRYTCIATNLVGSDSADTAINMLSK